MLVVGAQRLDRGVAPLIQGQVAFDPAVRFAGVVLNRVHGARHERKLRDAVERYCRIEVLGVLPDLPELSIAERHLGLTPLAEAPDLTPLVDRIGAAVARHLDLDRIEAIARTSAPFTQTDDGREQEEEVSAGQSRRAIPSRAERDRERPALGSADDREESAHGEVNAVRKACKKLNSIDLSGCIIYSTCETCPMCFTAIHWARIEKIVYGANIEDAWKFGFNELRIPNPRLKEMGGSKITLLGGLLRDECIELFEYWASKHGNMFY